MFQSNLDFSSVEIFLGLVEAAKAASDDLGFAGRLCPVAGFFDGELPDGVFASGGAGASETVLEGCSNDTPASGDDVVPEADPWTRSSPLSAATTGHFFASADPSSTSLTSLKRTPKNQEKKRSPSVIYF